MFLNNSLFAATPDEVVTVLNTVVLIFTKAFMPALEELDNIPTVLLAVNTALDAVA